MKCEFELLQNKDGSLALKKENYLLNIEDAYSLFKLPVNEVPNLDIDKLVNYYFNYEGFKVNKSEILTPSENLRLKSIKNVKNKRLKIILENLSGELKSTVLYKRVRRKGYPMKNKTFQRDLKSLAGRQKITRKVIMGGNGGTYSLIDLK